MNAFDVLLGRVQPGYEVAVKASIASIRNLVGPGCGEGLAVEQLTDAIADALEHRPFPPGESPSAVVARCLSVLEWCCGIAVEAEQKERLARLVRRDFRLQFEAAGLKKPKPDVAARRTHVVFIGALAAPLHSPSIGAADYLCALAADPKNRRIEVYHNGPIDPALAAYMAERLPASVRFHQIENHPDYLAQAVRRAPCTYHFWCYAAVNIDYSFLAMFGPTMMFTCADETPVQYVDVYWSSRPREHIERVWLAAPPSFRANYASVSAAALQIPAAVKVRSKAELGLAEGDMLVATVGNRLSVDLDEAYLTGMERVLRRRPDCRWLLVGALPDWLVGALHQVLGAQFLHVAYEPDLAGLLAAADLCLNPFRRGGGNSAIIAASAGAPVLTRGDIGDVGACVPAVHWASDADDYFQKLERLLDDGAERAAWATAQRAHLETWLDKSRYAAEVERLVALAFERFRTRRSRSLEAVFPEVGLVAAAA